MAGENYIKIDPDSAMDETGMLPTIKPLPELSKAAYHGLAGEFVRALEPSTEADPVAILGQVLVAFGAAVGRGPHLLIDGSRHGVNEFLAIVGESSKARKGTSWNRTRETLFHADSEFFGERVKSGLSSGEGLTYQVRDASNVFDPKTGVWVTIDPGVLDKRLLIIEEEFAGALRAVERDGNTLSVVLRLSWDGRKLSPLTKNNKIEATDPHISVIGQITMEELKKRLSETETANGFGNRFLWIFARRSKLLPFGGTFSNSGFYGEHFRETLDFASRVGEMGMTEGFKSAWEEVYPTLSEAMPGLAGSLTSRSEAHALRLTMIFALLDKSRNIDVPHLMAAIALIDFSIDSVSYIFGDATGDATGDKILETLRTGSGRLTLAEIHNLFNRHAPKAKLEAAISDLVTRNKITLESIPGESGGRPITLIRLKE